MHITYLVLFEHRNIFVRKPPAVLEVVNALIPVTFRELVAHKSSFHCFYPRLTNELFAFLEFCWTRRLVDIFVKECFELIHFISSALFANSDMVAVAKDCLVVVCTSIHGSMIIREVPSLAPCVCHAFMT